MIFRGVNLAILASWVVGIDPKTEAWPVGPQADPSSATKQVVAVKEAFNLGRKQWKGMVDMGQKMSTFPT